MNIVQIQRNHEILVGSITFSFLSKGLDDFFYLISEQILHQFWVGQNEQYIGIFGLEVPKGQIKQLVRVELACQ